MQGFGMQNVSGFAPPPPQMAKPDEGGGKGGGLGIVQGVLDIAAMIPGPQQPFLAGGAALGHIAKGAVTKNPMEAIGGVTGLAGAGIPAALGIGGQAASGAGKAVQGTQSFMPQVQNAMTTGAQANSFMPQAQNALMGGSNMGFDPLNPYEFLNPPNMYSQPKF